MEKEYNEKELSIYIGQKIRYYRKKRNMTQKDLGQKIKKSNNTISDYENAITAPNQDALFDLAHALDVSIDEFFPKREFSENIEDQIKKDDEFTLLQMESFKRLTAHLNTLNEQERKEFLRDLEINLRVWQNTYIDINSKK